MSPGVMSQPVAIVTNNERRGNKLKELLQANGIDALLYTALNADILPQIEEHPAAVILDLDGGGERERHIIHELINQDAIPVLFNDGTCLEGHAPALEQAFGRQVADKVVTVSEWGLPADPQDTAGPAAADGKTASVAGHRGAVARAPQSRPEPEQEAAEAPRLWVLGASLGGPEAVKRFIAAVPSDLPLAFMLVQHIGADHIALLKEQFRRFTAWRVVVAHAGQLPQAGQLIIAPMDRGLCLDTDGRIRLTPAVAGEPPCSIDMVMSAVAEYYGPRAGAIVFSGIGNDGVLGAREIRDHGGTLWVQSTASCVMSSMPDHVRHACPIDREGSPEELAEALLTLLRPERPRWRGAGPANPVPDLLAR